MLKVNELTNLVSVRRNIRKGLFTGHTAGMVPGYSQGNLVILPAKQAVDFMRYCQRNPKPRPLVGMSDTGNPMLITLGTDIDIRTDIPSYNIYWYGELVEMVNDIKSLWQNDFVAFIIGCSFSFEQAIMNEGIPRS